MVRIYDIPVSLYLLNFKYRDGSFFHSTYSGVQSILFVSLGGTEGCFFTTTGSLGSNQFLVGAITTLFYEKYTQSSPRVSINNSSQCLVIAC